MPQVPVFAPELDDFLSVLAAAGAVPVKQADGSWAGRIRVQDEVPIGAINGSNLDFVTVYPVAGRLVVYLNGLRQVRGPTEAYTVSGNTIHFNEAPIQGDDLIVDYDRN